jgi:catechol 2,3-dioxygenase-like lactoylglutathione lyase family enzyme
MFSLEVRFGQTCEINSIYSAELLFEIEAMNGVAHLVLSVRDVGRAQPFFVSVFEAHLGMTRVIDVPDFLYLVGKGTALGLSLAPGGAAFKQANAGLHHFCIRMRTREDVDGLVPVLQKAGAVFVRGPEESSYAPGYYSVLVEDPIEHIRIEFNHVPGKGLLAKL